MIKHLVWFECPIVSFIKVYVSMYFLLSTDLRVGEVDPAPPGVPGAGDGCPRVGALSVHLQPWVQLLLLGLGTRLVLRHSRRRRFLLYSSSGLVFLSSNLFKR